MSVTALIWANPFASDYRLGMPAACKQAEISLARLSTVRRGAQIAAAGYQCGPPPLFDSSLAQHTARIKSFTGSGHA